MGRKAGALYHFLPTVFKIIPRKFGNRSAAPHLGAISQSAAYPLYLSLADRNRGQISNLSPITLCRPVTKKFKFLLPLTDKPLPVLHSGMIGWQLKRDLLWK